MPHKQYKSGVRQDMPFRAMSPEELALERERIEDAQARYLASKIQLYIYAKADKINVPVITVLEAVYGGSRPGDLSPGLIETVMAKRNPRVLGWEHDMEKAPPAWFARAVNLQKIVHVETIRRKDVSYTSFLCPRDYDDYVFEVNPIPSPVEMASPPAQGYTGDAPPAYAEVAPPPGPSPSAPPMAKPPRPAPSDA